MKRLKILCYPKQHIQLIKIGIKFYLYHQYVYKYASLPYTPSLKLDFEHIIIATHPPYGQIKELRPILLEKQLNSSLQSFIVIIHKQCKLQAKSIIFFFPLN